MHKGKNYPFHPDYWATEAWFWPGFVPWKLWANLQYPATSPWDALGFPFTAVSDAGVVVDDRTQISYHWSLASPASATDLLISLEQIEIDSIKYARWKAKLLDATTEIADAWLYQGKPQRAVSTASNEWNLSDIVPPTSPFLYLACLPATYDDGGSPWEG